MFLPRESGRFATHATIHYRPRVGRSALAVLLFAAALAFSPIPNAAAQSDEDSPTNTSTTEEEASPTDTGGEEADPAPEPASTEPTTEATSGEEGPLVLDFEVILEGEVPRGVTASEADLAIVYTAQSRADGLRRIFTLQPGSDVPEQMSPEDGQQYSWASWAFNGNKIVFTARDGESGMPESVYWMNADGSDLELLLEVPFQSAQPKISADGTTLIFTGRLTGTTFTRLYAWDMTTGLTWNMSQVGNEGFLDSDPSFSPDDRSVVFIDSQANGVAVPGEIALMRSSGQGREQLTSNGLFDTDPQITADGSAIASARYTGEGEPRDPNSPNPFQVVLEKFKIIEVDTTTGAETELTEGLGCFRVPSDYSCLPDQGSSYLPKYTADDARVGYVSILSSNTTCICTVGRDGSDTLVRYSDVFQVIDWFDWVIPGPIPPNAALDPERPDVLPDAIGKLFDFEVIDLDDVPVTSTASDASLDVVFSAESRADGSSRIYLLEAASAEPIPLTPLDDRTYDSPSFAFGGNKIVFSAREPDGVFELWWMNRDGSDMQQLMAQVISLVSPSMSPDGTTLVFGAAGLIYGWDLESGFVFNATTASSTDAADFDPTYGESNDEIVFTAGGELATMSPEGTNRVLLTSNGATDTAPAIAHDRSALASARYLDGELPTEGAIGGLAIVHHDRTTGSEVQLTEAEPCHQVPARFACVPEQASGFFPLFTPDDQRLGYVGILSSRALCICTIGIDGGEPVARWLSTELAVGTFDWGAPEQIPASAVLDPTRPDDVTQLVDFAVVPADKVPLVSRNGLDVVFSAATRTDSLTRIYVLAPGSTTPVQVSPEDRKIYRWAAWALGTSKIVYTVQSDGGPEEIWWMNRDGTEARPLIAIPSSVTHPRISPDGTMLVFTFPLLDSSFSELYAFDLETGWIENISTKSGSDKFFDGTPAYNLRGDQIVATDQSQVAVMANDGSGRQLVTNDGLVHTNPALSFDGDWMVDAVHTGVEADSPFAVVLRSLVGAGQRALTQGERCEVVPDIYSCLPDAGSALYPIFTPDDQQVGFVGVLSSTTMCICIVAADGDLNAGVGFSTEDLVLERFDWAPPTAAPTTAVADPVHLENLLKDLLVTVANDDGVSIERTRADQFLREIIDISGSVQPRDASASADGSVIAFTGEVDPVTPAPPPLTDQGGPSSREAHYTINLRDQAIRDLPVNREDVIGSQLFVLNADGTGLRQITTPLTEDWRDAIIDGDQRGNVLGDVSPDGTSIVFTNISTLSEESFILRMDLATGQVLSLSNATAGALPVHDSDPKWSPDGETIAFVSDSWGLPEIWTMDSDGYNARPVSNGVAGRFPAWSSDADSLSFAAGNTLMVLDLETGAMREFASHPGATVSKSAWSSDGQFIAWIVFTDSGAADLYLRSVDGTRDLTKLTPGSAELGVDW